MKAILVSLMLLAVINPSYAGDLISRDDARSILSMSQQDWNAQVKLAANAEFSAYQETYGGTFRQVLKGPDWDLSTYPIYGDIRSAPITIEVKVTYGKGHAMHGLSLPQVEAICSKAFAQLKVEFSFVCGFAKASEELRYTFLISKPGSRADIDNLNSKGTYSFNQQEAEDAAKTVSKRLIPRYWAQLDAWADNRTATKEELIKVAATELPFICSKLATSYALAAGKAPSSSQEDREDWDFNADFCVKATIHRRFPQPEFKNPRIVDMLCNKKKSYEFNYNLCKRAGVLR